MFGTGGNKFEKTRGGLRRGDLVVLMDLCYGNGVGSLHKFVMQTLWKCGVEESLKEHEGFVYKEDSYRLDKSLV